MQAIYAQLYSQCVNIDTKDYLWGLGTPRKFPVIINEMFQGFVFIQDYKDNHFILNTGDWKDHLYKLELT